MGNSAQGTFVLCRNCGAQRNGPNLFCTECGHRFDDKALAASGPSAVYASASLPDQQEGDTPTQGQATATTGFLRKLGLWFRRFFTLLIALIVGGDVYSLANWLAQSATYWGLALGLVAVVAVYRGFSFVIAQVSRKKSRIWNAALALTVYVVFLFGFRYAIQALAAKPPASPRPQAAGYLSHLSDDLSLAKSSLQTLDTESTAAERDPTLLHDSVWVLKVSMATGELTTYAEDMQQHQNVPPNLAQIDAQRMRLGKTLHDIETNYDNLAQQTQYTNLAYLTKIHTDLKTSVMPELANLQQEVAAASH